MQDPSMTRPRLLIAEDEPLLAAEMVRLLETVWPEAEVVATPSDGCSATAQALALRPDVCWLDIRMPGQSGLEAARALAEDWPDDAGALPLLVFVTAYEQHAVDAFEAAAVDYVLKPVQTARLERTVALLKTRLFERQALVRAQVEASSPPAPVASASALNPDDLNRLSQLLSRLGMEIGKRPVDKAPSTPWSPDAEPPGPLKVIQAATGASGVVHFVPVEEVLVFEAADKYVRVLTAEREYLIRASLRELLPRLDPDRFWQIHRGTVVRAEGIDHALRDEAGRVTLVMRGLAERPVVSRLYAGRFKAM